MKSVLKYYIKRRILIMICISMLFIIIGFSIYQGSFLFPERDNLPVYIANNNPIPLVAKLGTVLATIIPIFEFSYKMRNKGIRKYEKFNLTKEKFFLTKYLVGYLEIIIPIFIYLITFYFRIILDPKGNLFNMEYYFLYYLVACFFIFIIYSIITFIYIKCHTIYDGVVCVGLSYIFGMSIAIFLNFVIKRLGNVDYFNDFFLYTITSPFQIVTKYFVEVIDRPTLPVGYFENFEKVLIILNVILGITCFILSIFTVKKEEENLKGKANSWFSYKILIPPTIFFLGLFSFLNLYIIPVLIGYLLYVLYRRSVKIKIIDIILIIVTVLLFVLLVYLP